MVIIADDLTGASDSGVQFARKGLKTAVVLKESSTNKLGNSDPGVLVYDTDTRSIPPWQAYSAVRSLCESLDASEVEAWYKKIDSTMRGNVGAEFDAIYETLQPDFIFFTPAYPRNGRVVKDGTLYVNDILLHMTEFARDLKSPMKESYIPVIVEVQSKKKVGLVTQELLREGQATLIAKLQEWKREDRPYILFDASTDEDLGLIVDTFKHLPYKIVWAGSAGLANAMVPDGSSVPEIRMNRTIKPVIAVIGSLHPHSRQQLDHLLLQPGVRSVELEVTADDFALEQKLERLLEETVGLAGSRCIVLHTGSKLETMHGLTPVQLSNRIANIIGQAAAKFIHCCEIERLILTGGDTAKQVCEQLGILRFEPLDEIEPGVPFGKFHGDTTFYGITKAGGFGSQQVLIHALSMLEGEDAL